MEDGRFSSWDPPYLLSEESDGGAPDQNVADGDPSTREQEFFFTVASLALQVCGIVFFTSKTAEQLLATHVITPLDACTYLGLDSGAPAIQVGRDPCPELMGGDYPG